jgi:transglutaminase-like putative cysteine protease
MLRRDLLIAATAVPVALCATGSAAASPVPEGWRQFEVTTRVNLRDRSATACLWLPLAQTAGGYQIAEAIRWSGTGQAELVREDAYGTPILRVTWDEAVSPRQTEVVQTVSTIDRGSLPSLPLSAAERRFWASPTASTPIDGIVRETAGRIVTGHESPRARLRAIYDWVVETTWRNPETRGCGTGDIASMLRTQNFGGKCADINTLMVGLARAAGFPARDVYGIRVADSSRFPSLGKSGDISKAQHCRAEVFMEDTGWFPVDPADVRKVVLEQKLTLGDPAVAALRDHLFGNWEMNWIGYNSATDIELPGAGGEQSNLPFLMYPCAITAEGQPDALDPATFRYEIQSREIPA